MDSTKATLNKPLRLALIGSLGKMGQEISSLLQEKIWSDKFQLVAGLTSQSKKELPAVDIVIDFSKKESTLAWLEELSQHKVPTLLCTTGFSAEDFSLIKSNLKGQAWAYIPNTSVGIYAFIRCLCGLVKFFNDIQSLEIHEIHHTQKKDSPSGTALLIKAALLDALQGKSYPQDILIKSAREGEVVGVHSVIIQRAYDRLIFSHEAQSRKLFAEGALSLAHKLGTKAPREKPYTFDELTI